MTLAASSNEGSSWSFSTFERLEAQGSDRETKEQNEQNQGSLEIVVDDFC